MVKTVDLLLSTIEEFEQIMSLVQCFLDYLLEVGNCIHCGLYLLYFNCIDNRQAIWHLCHCVYLL